MARRPSDRVLVPEVPVRPADGAAVGLLGASGAISPGWHGDADAGFASIPPPASVHVATSVLRPLADYEAAAALGDTTLPKVRDFLAPVDYFRVGHTGHASGDTRTVSERHLSFLLRQWELSAVWAPKKDDGDERAGGQVYANPAALRHKIKKRQPQAALLLIAALLFTATFVTAMYVEGGTPIEPAIVLEVTMISLFVTHVVVWLIVFVSSNFANYRSWSIVDGWNTITRMTLKVGLEDGDSNFHDSHMPSSISSSVATRGTTLNKLMIGVAYSLGVGLFIKFMLLNTWHGTLTAVGYLMIIATALYENTQYDMDDVHRSMADGSCAAKPMDDHRRGYVEQLKAPHRGRITIDDQLPVTSAAFSNLHMIGVLGFIGVSFVGHTIRRFNHTPLLRRESTTWLVSLVSVVLGVVFVLLNADLSRGDKSCCGGHASRTRNKVRGLCCIAIELTALALATGAGLVYNLPWTVAEDA